MCVPHFLVDAIREQSGVLLDPVAIAHVVGVRFPGAKSGTTDGYIKDYGVCPSEVQRRLPVYLAKKEVKCTFGYLPFAQIPLGLYWEVLAELFAHDLIVGVGFEFPERHQGALPERHVARVVDVVYERSSLVLKDVTSGGNNRVLERQIEWVELAVRRAHGGFWIMAGHEVVPPTLYVLDKKLRVDLV